MDVFVIGAGPVGCVSALAFARQGADVLVVEANPQGSERLAGEWLHPPALEVLRRLDIELSADDGHVDGDGFVVFPDDGLAPIVLPYAPGARGLSCEHSKLVSVLRGRIEAHPRITYVPFARVTGIHEQQVTYQGRQSASRTVLADLIVGSGGRYSVAHRALGLDAQAATFSRMAGLILEDVTLPFEGYGHVFLGGPGPVLLYRLDRSRARLCLDVPLALGHGTSMHADLWDAFHAMIPRFLHGAFRRALNGESVCWATNQLRPRVNFGREGLALVGDSVGCYHPLTALGMTLGFEDAYTLATSANFASYRTKRIRRTRVSEMLAVSLYEVFADTSEEIVSIRSAIYDLWRRDSAERLRTMGFLAGQDSSPTRFTSAFLRMIYRAGRTLVRNGLQTGRWRHAGETATQLASRVAWLLSGTFGTKSVDTAGDFARTAERRYGAALKASRPRSRADARSGGFSSGQSRSSELPDVREALDRGARRLASRQAPDGSWEGEVVWCPMLAAQYVLTCHITKTPIEARRRDRLLRHFETTLLPSGTWGLHELSEPYLFVTTLVYVAARLLGVDRDDPLLLRAGRFIRSEGGVVPIPSWGKFWLAMLNLYPWDAVNPVLPELWSLPVWLPIHPSKYYCHTRHIYMAMAAIYGHRLTAPCTPVVRALREELYPDGYDNVDPAVARRALRSEEIRTPPSGALRWLYRLLPMVDRLQDPERRSKVLRRLRDHIRFELRATDHMSLSPVSGLLNLIALWLDNPDDDDLRIAQRRFERWLWEDDREGTRVAGARSVSWDTAFAVQALAAAAPHVDAEPVLGPSDEFLRAQQIRRSPEQTAEFYRTDPRGGYCFGHSWHGWPVSDCTAEALVARLANPHGHATKEELTEGTRFILRCQNSDGGFGSYEANRIDLPLEWLNPAEMFGGSMRESSLVECTSSCVSALSAVRQQDPDVLPREIDRAIVRARRWLELKQLPDGSWRGAWGIHFIYGTMFGARGLLAAGLPAYDPRIRKTCAWLRARQRSDGGWGEHFSGCRSGDYAEHHQSQVIQTAWAMTTLLEARDPDWDCIERGARFLAASQLSNGEWPKQDPAGVFFQTALLDYTLYRSYFPIHALSLFESRRRHRLEFVRSPERPRQELHA